MGVPATACSPTSSTVRATALMLRQVPGDTDMLTCTAFEPVIERSSRAGAPKSSGSGVRYGATGLLAYALRDHFSNALRPSSGRVPSSSPPVSTLWLIPWIQFWYSATIVEPSS